MYRALALHTWLLHIQQGPWPCAHSKCAAPLFFLPWLASTVSAVLPYAPAVVGCLHLSATSMHPACTLLCDCVWVCACVRVCVRACVCVCAHILPANVSAAPFLGSVCGIYACACCVVRPTARNRLCHRLHRHTTGCSAVYKRRLYWVWDCVQAQAALLCPPLAM
jgi:hypothetical protein